MQVAIRVGCGWSVRAFDDDFRANRRRVVHGDLILERRGNQDVHVELEQVLAIQGVGTREAVDGVVLLGVLDELRDVEPLRVEHAAFPVDDADDDRAGFPHEELRRDRSDVPESLHRHRRALDVEADVLRRFPRRDHHAAAGRLAPPERAAELHRLAGDDRGRRVADVHGIGVHHPRHDLRVGVDVGRRDVLFGADCIDDLGDVAACQRFDLALGHLRRVADDPALAAAERNVRDGALPRHPRRERGHFIERHAGVIPDAALRRAERDVVLHAVPGEDFDLPVVHLDGTGDGDLTLGMGEDFPDAGLEIENAGRPVELLEHGTEDRSVSSRHDAPSRSWSNGPAYRAPRRLVKRGERKSLTR